MQNLTLTEFATARRALAAQVLPQVVGLERSRGGRCSGVLWDAGLIVTAAEALHGADAVTVHTADGELPARLLACDLSVDVAVLAADTGLSGASGATTADPAVGDAVLIAGRVQQAPTLVWSQLEFIGGPWRSRSGGELERLIRISPGLHPSVEGGGVFDLGGRLVAMAVRGPRGIALGIPVGTMARIVDAVKEHGRLPQPYLGVRLQSVHLDAPLQQQLNHGSEGALVVGVEPDSPATGQLLFGDLVLAVAGKSVAHALDLKVALAGRAPQSAVDLTVYRAGVSQTITVRVGERGAA